MLKGHRDHQLLARWRKWLEEPNLRAALREHPTLETWSRFSALPRDIELRQWPAKAKLNARIKSAIVSKPDVSAEEAISIDLTVTDSRWISVERIRGGP
jgi:hypothetical protein